MKPNYKTYYQFRARQDVKEAKAWYKKQQPGLEKRFASAIIKAISQMVDNPYAYAIRYKNMRIIHPKTFPYSIHFYINEVPMEIVTTALIHEYRDMAIIQNRQ